MVEKIFTDNIRKIKGKWYKEQQHQIQLQLRQAEENGNEDLVNKLLCEKEEFDERKKNYTKQVINKIFGGDAKWRKKCNLMKLIN